MGDSIDLISTIKELEEMQPELRELGKYRMANMLDFAIGYLNKYKKLLIEQRNPNEDYETELELEKAIKLPTRVKAKADADSTKICGRCNKELPATKESFASSKKGLYGLRSICKDCDKEYRDANKEKKNEYNRIYRQKNK